MNDHYPNDDAPESAIDETMRRAMARADARRPGDPFHPVAMPDGSYYVGTMFPGESTELTFISNEPVPPRIVAEMRNRELIGRQLASLLVAVLIGVAYLLLVIHLAVR